MIMVIVGRRFDPLNHVMEKDVLNQSDDLVRRSNKQSTCGGSIVFHPAQRQER